MDPTDRVLACVDELIGLDDPTQLPSALAGPLHHLIPYDFLVYNEINTATGEILTVSEPTGVESKNAVFETYADQHPLLRHYQKTRDPSVLRLSDHISRTEFHRLELYNDFLRVFGIEHQIVCTLPAVRTVAIGLVLTRKGRDFSADDCEALEQLRPHVLRAYRVARRQAVQRRRLEALEASLEAGGRAVIVVDATDEVVTASANAEKLLLAYGAGPVASFGRRFGQRESLRLSGDEGYLVVTRAGLSLFLDERGNPYAPTRLRTLGLTAREAEVLQSAAGGASNHAIADRLGITVRTVKKHLERIYEKLGVSSRLAAVARASSAPD